MRNQIKSQLQKIGLFPAARAAYRKLSPQVKSQRKKELALYSQILKPGSLCFDVGANLGQRTEVFLELGAKSVLVEPNANCYETLSYLFADNERVTLVREAIGATVGTVEFYAHGTDATGSVLPDWDAKVFGHDRRPTKVVVSMATLDSLINRFGVPDFTKIDVEGFEIDVLKGLSQPLPVLSFEFHASETDRIRACVDLLKKFGKLEVRAASMECDWLTDRTDDYESCIDELVSRDSRGDMFVWVT